VIFHSYVSLPEGMFSVNLRKKIGVLLAAQAWPAHLHELLTGTVISMHQNACSFTIAQQQRPKHMSWYSSFLWRQTSQWTHLSLKGWPAPLRLWWFQGWDTKREDMNQIQFRHSMLPCLSGAVGSYQLRVQVDQKKCQLKVVSWTPLTTRSCPI
jgi:hypothetical protein